MSLQLGFSCLWYHLIKYKLFIILFLQINAYILCGKLRSAYLMAVKAERVEDVQRIAGAAQRMGQTAVKNICNKWLEQKKNT